MNLNTYNNLSKSKVDYLVAPVSDLVLEDGYLFLKENDEYGSIELTENVKESICRMVGISPSLSKSLYSIDKDLWDTVLNRLYSYYNKDTIIIVLNEYENGKFSTKGLCNTQRETVPSFRFINKVLSYFSDNKNLEVSDIIFSNSGNISNVILLTNTEYETFTKEKYRLGYVIYNDEFYNSYCRAVVFKDSVYYYLPSKYYNLSTSRYDRTTDSSEESLDIMLLRINDDTESNVLENTTLAINYFFDNLNKLNYSYQEYLDCNTIVLNVCTKSCTAEIDTVSDMLESINDIKDIYGEIQSDYLWKCTAFSSNTFSKFVDIVKYVEVNCGILPEDIVPLREYIGQMLCSKKMKEVVADDRRIQKTS